MSEDIIFIHTPKICKECIFYRPKEKECSKEKCAYPARCGRR